MILETFHYDRDAKKWSVRVLPVLDGERTLVLGVRGAGAPGRPRGDPGAAASVPAGARGGVLERGEIAGTSVRDGSLSVAVARFERTTLATAQVEVASASGRSRRGRRWRASWSGRGCAGARCCRRGSG